MGPPLPIPPPPLPRPGGPPLPLPRPPPLPPIGIGGANMLGGPLINGPPGPGGTICPDPSYFEAKSGWPGSCKITFKIRSHVTMVTLTGGIIIFFTSATPAATFWVELGGAASIST